MHYCLLLGHQPFFQTLAILLGLEMPSCRKVPRTCPSAVIVTSEGIAGFQLIPRGEAPMSCDRFQVSPSISALSAWSIWGTHRLLPSGQGKVSLQASLDLCLHMNPVTCTVSCCLTTPVCGPFLHGSETTPALSQGSRDATCLSGQAWSSGFIP